MIVGIIGCLLYVAGDFLFAATGKGQTTESIGFHRMFGLLKVHVSRAGNSDVHVSNNCKTKDIMWVRLFKVAYITGTVAWTYVHAMFMVVALIFKYTYQTYGDMQAAAEIARYGRRSYRLRALPTVYLRRFATL